MESAQKTNTATIWKVGPGPDGTVELLALLPKDASGIETTRFEMLQRSYSGHLSVENMCGRPVIGRKFVPHGKDDVSDEMGRFRKRLKSHVGVASVLQ